MNHNVRRAQHTVSSEEFSYFLYPVEKGNAGLHIVNIKCLELCIKGVVHLKKKNKKNFADNLLTPMSSKMSTS